jgi:ankyrin repeat protein
MRDRNRLLGLRLEVMKRECHFFEYATDFWGRHAREKAQMTCKDTIVNFLQDRSKVEYAALEIRSGYREYVRGAVASALHVSCHFGLDQIITAELDRWIGDWNAPDSYGHSPLTVAVIKGHVETVRVLLAQTNIDVNEKRSSTRDFYAEPRFFSRKTNTLISQASDRCAPLSCAARYGREDVMKLLLARDDIDINLREWDDCTPLHEATAAGQEAVTRLLLAQPGIDINAKDQDHGTPLHNAAFRGNEAVIRLLLAQSDIDVNAKDTDFRTPLHYAAFNGHETATRLLIERTDVDVNVQDRDGETPLHKAIRFGLEVDPVVRLLLTRPDIKVNLREHIWGATPLYQAIRRGVEAAARLLVARADVDVNVKDKIGCTALHAAVMDETDAYTRMLLARPDIQVNVQDNRRFTALHWASVRGAQSTVELLLARDDVNPNTLNWIDSKNLAARGRRGRRAVVLPSRPAAE